jgi:aspartyl protease family protein
MALAPHLVGVALDGDQFGRLIYLLALLLLVSAGVLGFYRRQLPLALSHAVIWLAIIAGLVVVYAAREPLLRLAEPIIAELNPSRAVLVTTPQGRDELTIRRSPDGHFRIRAEANGTPVEFLVDTGATITVLSYSDARRLGFGERDLRFDRLVQTAAGPALSARVRLESLSLGPYRLRDLSAGVMPDGALSISLLGMNALNRFAAWRVESDRLVLETERGG